MAEFTKMQVNQDSGFKDAIYLRVTRLLIKARSLLVQGDKVVYTRVNKENVLSKVYFSYLVILNSKSSV